MQTFHISLLKKASQLKKFKDNRNIKKLLDEINFVENALLEDPKYELSEILHEIKDNTLIFLKENLLSDFEKKKEFLFQIQTGNGGIDAEELSLKLLKTYTQYFERKRIPFNILDINYSSAGLKKCIGKVQTPIADFLMEEGIHRFIRISPSNQKRQTSFVAFSIYPYISENDKAIILEEKDLRIDVFRASGAGGQHVNTTESAVRIIHIPTGITVQCQNERSQHQNKATAMNMLRSLLLKRKEKELESTYQRDKELISWSNHFRTYTFHPTKRIKDDRLEITIVSGGQFQEFFEGKIENFLENGIWSLMNSRIDQQYNTEKL